MFEWEGDKDKHVDQRQTHEPHLRGGGGLGVLLENYLFFILFNIIILLLIFLCTKVGVGV